MGKKLRTRELLTDTDHENDVDNFALPIIATIQSDSIRQRLSNHRTQRSHQTKNKLNNFRRRYNNRTLGGILPSGLFQCPICLELMVAPVMMQCGHTYCFRCLQSNAAYSERCCLCRNDQQGVPHIPLRFAETLIQRFLLPSGPELLRYLCRTTDSAEWTKRRRAINYRLGLVVDFQDRCNVWRRGVIISTAEPGEVEVRVNVKGVDSFQKVEIGSRRLAPYTFFTRSRYLEDFPPCLPEHDRTQAELSKLEFHFDWREEDAFHFPQEEPEQVQSQNFEEYSDDQAIRIFNSEMNEIDLILNL